MTEASSGERSAAVVAPAIKRIWDQMSDPKYCIAMGGCASAGGPYVNSYSVVVGRAARAGRRGNRSGEKQVQAS